MAIFGKRKDKEESNSNIELNSSTFFSFSKRLFSTLQSLSDVRDETDRVRRTAEENREESLRETSPDGAPKVKGVLKDKKSSFLDGIGKFLSKILGKFLDVMATIGGYLFRLGKMVLLILVNGINDVMKILFKVIPKIIAGIARMAMILGGAGLIAAGLAVAATTAIAYAIDKGLKRGADKAIQDIAEGRSKFTDPKKTIAENIAISLAAGTDEQRAYKLQQFKLAADNDETGQIAKNLEEAIQINAGAAAPSVAPAPAPAPAPAAPSVAPAPAAAAPSVAPAPAPAAAAPSAAPPKAAAPAAAAPSVAAPPKAAAPAAAAPSVAAPPKAAAPPVKTTDAPAAPQKAGAPKPAGKEPSPSDSKPKKVGSESGKKAMIKAMDDAKVTNPSARAAIMAQVAHESGGFTTLSENLNYKAPTLLKLFPKKFTSPEDAAQVAAGGSRSVAERIYGGRMGNASEDSGDGYMFRGRGFVQLTGKENYTKFGVASNPDSVAELQTAADTAMKYMLQYKGNWDDVKAVTKFVNAGYNGLDDRMKHFQAFLNDPTITQVGGTAHTIGGGGGGEPTLHQVAPSDNTKMIASAGEERAPAGKTYIQPVIVEHRLVA